MLNATDEKAPAGYVEIRGLTAPAFDPQLWETGSLNLLPDVRHPFLEPLPGKARNIYAPSAVELPTGWRVFYGAWDGVPTMNDRIYSLVTKDFLEFKERQLVIEHGPFQHVCNVSALRIPDGSLSLMCTAYPDSRGLNKPIFFHSPDGKIWNDSPVPYVPKPEDIINISGYDKYPEADINGMNVILHEDGKYRLYFCNFKDFGNVYRATGSDGRNFVFEKTVLRFNCMVNDVKKFNVGEKSCYLMGVHANGDKLWYSLSADGLNFKEPHLLLTNRDQADQYIVALGWVVAGDQERPGRKVLGVLYGAGAVKSLDANRIFARWLQKKIVFRGADGTRIEGAQARGPNRQLLALPGGQKTGSFEIYAEDGKTLLGKTEAVTLMAGKVYELKE